jgi:outer membrane receptor protein involved in Fe transport
MGVSGQWRYFAAVRNDVLSNDPDLHVPIDTQPWNHFPGNDRIKAQSYFDLTLTARLGDRYNLRIGANNIFDREPPHLGNTAPSGGGPGAVVTSPPFGNGNTFPQVYDALGRFVFAGVTLDF